MDERTLVQKALTESRDALTVRRVFGEPIERDGLMIIPAAEVSGGFGGGGGGGKGPGSGGGYGLGYGVSARPVGAFVVKDGVVTWKPAVDAGKLALRGQLLGLVFILVVRSVVKTLAKRR